MSKRILSLCITTSLVCWFAAPAAAQSAPAANTTADPGDIIVTARRVEERLQDVPISVSVLNQTQLSNRNIFNPQDLATYVPSLTASQQFGAQNTTFSIRGFTQDGNTAPSVGTYFADVVAPHGGVGAVPSGDGAGPGNFFDLQNVQVLKGPQGTLFGRNTTGGAVLLVPQRPTDKFEGYVEGSLGNYDMKRIQGVLNLPVSASVRLRFGVDHQTRDGYAINSSGIGPRDFDDVNYTAVRASMIVDLSPNLESYTVAYYSKSDTHGSLPKLFACNPGSAFAFLCQPQLASAKPGFFSVENDNPDAASRLREWQVINTTTWHESAALTIKNILSYGAFQDYLFNDLFGVNWTFPVPGNPSFPFSEVNSRPGSAIGRSSLLTEEFQIQGGVLDQRLTYQAGVYFEDSRPDGISGAQGPTLISCSNVFALQCTDYLGALAGRPTGFVVDNTVQKSSTDLGVYAQANYKLTDKLKFTAGIRYTSDHSSSHGFYVDYNFPTPNTPVGFCQNTFVRSPALPIVSPSDCEARYTQKSSAPTWLLDLDYKPDENVLLYAKWARGYRQGDVVQNAPEGYNTFKPEKLDSYEVGAKTSFNGAVRGTLDVSGFYNKFDNQQLNIGFSSSENLAQPTEGITNAGKSRIWGAEVEATVTPFTGFTLDGAYTYLNTKLLSITFPPTVPGSRYDTFAPTSSVGDVLPLAAKNQLSLTGTYALPLPVDDGRVSVSATYSYKSRQLITRASPFGTIAPIGLVNANITWASPFGEPFDLSVFVTNLTDKHYFSYVAGTYTTVGLENAQLGEPRMIGGRLRIRFGG
jgi:iron complex outermembrane receptor protein